MSGLKPPTTRNLFKSYEKKCGAELLPENRKAKSVAIQIFKVRVKTVSLFLRVYKRCRSVRLSWMLVTARTIIRPTIMVSYGMSCVS